MSVGKKVGVGIAVVVLLIFAAVILYKWVKRNRYKLRFNNTSAYGDDPMYQTFEQYAARQRYTTAVRDAQKSYDPRAIDRGTYNAANTMSRIRR